jgi:hypothetical protein
MIYQFPVIECPYCHTPLRETSPECSGCQMDLEKLARAMGPTPVILAGISDGCNLFSRPETKRLSKVISAYQSRFPQCRLHVITRIFDQKAELPPIIFWIFNRADLSEGTSKQGKNRDIVILIEPKRKQAAMIVGYGLEPILPQQALDQIIERAQPYLTSGEYLAGMEIAIEGLSELLKSVSQELSQSLGLQKVLATDFGANDY